MKSMFRVIAAALAAMAATGALAEGWTIDRTLTAEQIVDRNVAARGGLEAWRKVETMAWLGHIVSPGAPEPNLPFALRMKRPDKTRFELTTQNQKSMRIFDGRSGWKIRGTREGKPDLQPFTPEEVKFAHDAPDFDVPLLDYAAKGESVALDGVEELDGRPSYRLAITMPSGAVHHVWIDGQSFLDVKYDRAAHGLQASSGTVSVYNREFQTVEGLKIPIAIEIGAGPAQAPDKMLIERVAINPPLEDRVFAKPGAHGHRNRRTVELGAR